MRSSLGLHQGGSQRAYYLIDAERLADEGADVSPFDALLDPSRQDRDPQVMVSEDGAGERTEFLLLLPTNRDRHDLIDPERELEVQSGLHRIDVFSKAEDQSSLLDLNRVKRTETSDHESNRGDHSKNRLRTEGRRFQFNNFVSNLYAHIE